MVYCWASSYVVPLESHTSRPFALIVHDISLPQLLVNKVTWFTTHVCAGVGAEVGTGVGAGVGGVVGAGVGDGLGVGAGVGVEPGALH